MSKFLKVILFLSVVANFVLGIMYIKVNTEYTMYKHFLPDNQTESIVPLESIK